MQYLTLENGLFVAIALLVVWIMFGSKIEAWFKRIESTKGAQKIIADVKSILPSNADVEAAHAALDKQIADAKAVIDAATAKKSQLTQAVSDAINASK